MALVNLSVSTKNKGELVPYFIKKVGHINIFALQKITRCQ
jgi:hypothetical protein